MTVHEQGELFSMPDPVEAAMAEPELMVALDRLDFMNRQAGFLPTSRRELNESFSLLSFMQEPGGAAKHIAEVARHQDKHEADPVRTTRSIILEYSHYARRARVDRTSLLTLKEELEETDGVHTLSSPKDEIYTGLGQLVRYIDLSHLALNKRPEDFPFMPLRKYTPVATTPDSYVMTQPSEEVEARIKDVLSHTRKYEAERWVKAAVEDQTHREDFWIDRLREIKKHQAGGQLRALTSRILADLGAKDPSVA